jgi:hypothetical protein
MKTTLAQANPELAKQWCYAKNAELTPDSVAPNCNKKVWWICPHGHVWEAEIKSRNRNGYGCPVCSGLRVLKGFNDLAFLNPDLASQWHPTKNKDLTPEMVTVNSGKKVWWICGKGHEWQSRIADRSDGNGCPVCSGWQVVKGFNDLATVNRKLAKQWHPTKNDKLTPEMITAGSPKKVWWKCPCGHEWAATVESRGRRGCGCPAYYLKSRRKISQK